jgi:hypothetical protein
MRIIIVQNSGRKSALNKKSRITFASWQPGYHIKTRGFPSPDFSGFGLVLYEPLTIKKFVLYTINNSAGECQ